METTRNVPRRAGLVLAAAIACWLTPRPASAGGFQLNEMAPRYLGTALAGMAPRRSTRAWATTIPRA
ncbi:MAG: hypothetical protein ACKO2K_14875 [Alphaproteobacteria bacterium]